MIQSDSKKWARQKVKSSFQEILAGTYQLPSQKEMEAFIQGDFYDPFDAHKVRTKIRELHPSWSAVKISEELERYEREHIRENDARVKWFAHNTIVEIEKLIKSLNQQIAKWKVTNL